MNKFDAFILALSRYIDNPKVAEVYDRAITGPVRSYVDICEDGPAAMAQAAVVWARGGSKPEWLRSLDL